MLLAILDSHLGNHPSAVSSDMKHNIYMDNVVSGVQNTDEVLKHYNKANKIMKEAGLRLRSWGSNDAALREIAENEKK